MTITQEYLKSILHYNPETGLFTWKVTPTNNVPFGSIAGYPVQGYIIIGINKKLYRAHRLAWLYMYGCFPIGILDHRNRDRADNKISNLRLANKQQNAYNCQVYKNNTSGFRGVSWHKASNKWRATCSLQGKSYNLGVYITAEEASIVYEEFVKENHGEFYVY